MSIGYFSAWCLGPPCSYFPGSEPATPPQGTPTPGIGYFSAWCLGPPCSYFPGSEPATPPQGTPTPGIGYFSAWCLGPPCSYFSGSEPSFLDLVDALVSVVQLEMVATGSLTWFGAGKAPPRQALPYAEIEGFDEEPDWQSDNLDGTVPFDDYADIPINIYASTKFAAKQLGRQLARLLTDAPLLFIDGDLLLLRRGSKGTAELDPDPAPGGGDCWQLPILFHAITAKVID
jgi:hypothetical protein